MRSQFQRRPRPGRRKFGRPNTSSSCTNSFSLCPARHTTTFLSLFRRPTHSLQGERTAPGSMQDKARVEAIEQSHPRNPESSNSETACICILLTRYLRLRLDGGLVDEVDSLRLNVSFRSHKRPQRTHLGDVGGKVGEAGVKEGLLRGGESSNGVDFLDSSGLRDRLFVSCGSRVRGEKNARRG